MKDSTDTTITVDLVTQIYVTLVSTDSNQYTIDIQAGAANNQFALGVYDPIGLAASDSPGVTVNSGQIGEVDITQSSITFIPAAGGINATVMMYLWATDLSVKSTGVTFGFHDKLPNNSTVTCNVQVSDDDKNMKKLNAGNASDTVKWKVS